MRRFSQRNSLVTLNEINITPLLDLAFVLLIIFVITRPMLEQTIDMNLPKGGQASGKVDPKNLQRVEITANGVMRLNGARIYNVDQIVQHLVRAKAMNPNMIVDIRADTSSPWGDGVAVINGCVKNNITKYVIRTAPEK